MVDCKCCGAPTSSCTMADVGEEGGPPSSVQQRERQPGPLGGGRPVQAQNSSGGRNGRLREGPERVSPDAARQAARERETCRKLSMSLERHQAGGGRSEIRFGEGKEIRIRAHVGGASHRVQELHRPCREACCRSGCSETGGGFIGGRASEVDSFRVSCVGSAPGCDAAPRRVFRGLAIKGTRESVMPIVKRLCRSCRVTSQQS